MAACPHCGYAKTPAGKSKCYSCGKPLDDAASDGTAAQGAPTAASVSTGAFPGQKEGRLALQNWGRKWEHAILSLQWHKGVLGMGKGWDEKMFAQIKALEDQGYELATALTQPDPTWFTLFFKRQLQ